MDNDNAEKYWNLIKEYDKFKRIDYAPMFDMVNEYSTLASTIKNGVELSEDFLAMQDILNRNTMKRLETDFQEEIHKHEVRFIQQSYKYYETEMKHDDWQHMQQYYRNIEIRPEEKEKIEGIIGRAINWQFPGMELSPGINHFTDKLVGLDPLYIVDKFRKPLLQTERHFNEAYRRRLRTYVMPGEARFDNLPQGQMGLIFSFVMFERMPLDIIKQYLRQFMSLLRPNGKVIMTYNNCLLKSSLDITLFRKYRLFNTMDHMIPLVHGHGFDNIRSIDVSSNISVLEFEKPGDFYTQRAGQTLGKIVKTY